MQPTRRSLLAGLATAPALLRTSTAGAETPAATAAEVCTAVDPGGLVIDWRGVHQAGIVTRQPSHGLFVAFDLLVPDRPGLESLLRLLSERISVLTGTDPIQQAEAGLMPPPESGLMGAHRVGQALTIMLSLGASTFADARYGLAEQTPAELITMERFPNDAIDPSMAHGDVMLQICAATTEATIYALRDIIRQTSAFMAPRWQITGFLPPRPMAPAEVTPRNMLGFKDGTANLKASDAVLMDRHVWVQPGAKGEPGWTAGGSYQVVRLIRNFVERWDRTQLAGQEAIIGRHKLSGAPLGLTGEADVPDFASPAMPANAHIRLANPRTPATEANLILRRGFNYSLGLDRAGRMNMGLIFCSYQASLNDGFRTVQARLNSEPLEEYIKPFGGGYFFALPGVTSADGFLGAGLLHPDVP